VELASRYRDFSFRCSSYPKLLKVDAAAVSLQSQGYSFLTALKIINC
jgi:hypothetical protein